MKENSASTLETKVTLTAGAGGLAALERWLALNEDAFKAWPGLTGCRWARVPGHETVSLFLTYESQSALEANYERWYAAAELMERQVLGGPPSQTSIVSAPPSSTGSPASRDAGTSFPGSAGDARA